MSYNGILTISNSSFSSNTAYYVTIKLKLKLI